MEFTIDDFENVNMDIRTLLDFVMQSNQQSIKELAMILYPDSVGRDIANLTRYLYVMLDHIGNSYKEFTIKKKNGKLRTITKPDKALADIQKRIYQNILKDAPVSYAAAAYIRGRSIRDATAKHVGQPVLVKLDIRSFFESTGFNAVKEVFLQRGFDRYQAITLANFCCYKGRLPQGTSTSPMISNLVMTAFDEALDRYCLEKRISYTRYSDDMIFSGDFEPQPLIAFVKRLLEKNGYSLHHGKTKVIRQGQRQTALGVVLNEKQQVSKAYRKQIRQEVHYCAKYSVKAHLEHRKDQRFLLPSGAPDCAGYLENLYGRILFALQINPDDTEMLSYKQSLQTAIT